MAGTPAPPYYIDMKNGIVIDGIQYKTVRALNPIATIDPCERCDLKRICERKNCQYPCDIFFKRGYAIYFRKQNEK